MTRYCLGPACRDLTPVRGPRSLYCAACRRAVTAALRRRLDRAYRRRNAVKLWEYRRSEGRMAAQRAASLRWYRAHRAQDNARRRRRVA